VKRQHLVDAQDPPPSPEDLPDAVDDFAGRSQLGVGLLDLSHRKGWRSSTSTYVKEARKRPNLSVETGALALQIEISRNRATGVRYTARGKACLARCRGEVVVASGAIGSPKLLMLSGVGPADHLREHGIDVVNDLPGVGANLQDHTRVPVLYRSLVNFAPFPSGSWGKISAMLRFLATGRGLLSSSGIAAVIAFQKILPESKQIDCQFTPGIWGGDQNHPDDGCINLEPCLVGTRSRGHVRLANSDPSTFPLIDPAYMSEPDDLRTLIGGIRLARDLASTRAFAGFLAGESSPGLDKHSNHELAEHVRNHLETCFHPVGTCRMGDDEAAVVDHRLAVRGLQGLRVVDASVMPRIINGNTNAPTAMIAEKGADLILGHG